MPLYSSPLIQCNNIDLHSKGLVIQRSFNLVQLLHHIQDEHIPQDLILFPGSSNPYPFFLYLDVNDG